MIEQIFKFDDFTKSATGDADLRQNLAELMSGIPLPTLSRHERKLLESRVILRPLKSGPPSADEMLHPRLTILADDLTDPNELRQLRSLAEDIQDARRRQMSSETRRAFMPSLYVLGPGAEYSEAHPYRSPEAQEIRDGLTARGVIFFERPPDNDKDAADPDQLIRYMEGLLNPR
jgi:hypothetical protein